MQSCDVTRNPLSPSAAIVETSTLLLNVIAQSVVVPSCIPATPLPGMLPVIPGEEQGVLYTDGAEDMPNKIITLLQSNEHRKNLAKAGLDYVRRVHSHEKVVDELENRLEEAIAEKRSRV